MRFHAVHRVWLRTPPAGGASAAVIGTWVRVSAYAADVEAGVPDASVAKHRPLGRARLTQVRTWTERAWLSTCDTTRAAVNAMVRAGLAVWDGDNLILDGYDLWGEVRTKRIRHSEEDAGRDAGRNSRRDAAQGRGGEPEGYERRGTGSERTAPGNAPPPDDDGAPDCVGDVLELNDGDENMSPMASTGSRLARGLR